MEILAAVTTAMKIFDKLLDSTPEYEEKKRLKYGKLKRAYNEAIHADFVDTAAVDQAQADLMEFMDGEVQFL